MALVERKRRSSAGFDLTPLIDVVFQLLIFLMISSHFTRPESTVELPNTSATATLPDERRTIRITLLPGGGIEIEGGHVAAEQFGEFVVENFDDLLAGLDGLDDVFAEGLLLDLFDEGLGDLVFDIGLQEGEADLAEGIGDVFLGDAAHPAEVPEGLVEIFG